MDNQPLFHLLRTLSDAVDQGNSEETAKRVIEYLSCTLSADACALYLQRLDQYVLSGQSSAVSEFVFPDSWQGGVPSQVAFYQDQETISRIFSDGSCQCCLLLPIKTGDKVIGIWVARWLQQFHLDTWVEKDLTFFQIIGQLLGNSLYAQSEIQRLQMREVTLERISKQAIDELESSKKHLSRELHDEVGQAMTSILLQLKLLQQEQDIEVIMIVLVGCATSLNKPLRMCEDYP